MGNASAIWRFSPARRSRRLTHFFQLLERHLALQARKVIDEQDTLKVVHLVLQSRRQQALDLFLVGRAVQILPAGADARGPLYLGIDFGD